MKESRSKSQIFRFSKEKSDARRAISEAHWKQWLMFSYLPGGEMTFWIIFL